MAVAVGAVLYVVGVLQISHGYWIGLTLTVMLRPFEDATRTRSWQRILGTLGGALLALVLAVLLPLWAMVVALAVSMVLTIAYSAQGDYLRQVLFLAPSVVLLSSTSSVGIIASERAIATICGALLAGVIAVLLVKWDARTAVAAA